MNRNTLDEAIGSPGRCEKESLSKSIGENMARRSYETEREHRSTPGPGKGLKSVSINIHHSTGSKGGPVSREQGGTQYKPPVVKGGSLRSSAPGHGDGRGSPHKAKR